MVCCSNETEVSIDTAKIDLRVTSKGRKCTNVPCIIIFIMAYIVFIAFLVIGLLQGDMNR